MKMKRFLPVIFSLFISSCTNLNPTGTINFVLEEGAVFADPSFSTNYIKGESNTIIVSGLPQAKKEGYYFVGWREYINGSYQFLQKRLITDSSSPFFGQEVYLYPYGVTTLYTYFEPEETFVFDLNVGEEYEPKIVPPVSPNRDFDAENLTLYGYEKKEFASSNYLPTATCLNKTFSYWAIEYKLIEQIDPNTKKVFYKVDEYSEKGEYNFLDFYKNAQSFSFPQISGEKKSITLKAIWVDNSTVTVNLGLDDLQVSFFAQNKNIYSDIIETIENNLGQIEYGENKEIYIRDREYKLIGCFLDSDYKEEFPISSDIGEQSISLYLLWGKKINVTIDYNGGTLNGESSLSFISYGYDSLPSYIKDEYPTKETTFFNHYLVNNEKINLFSFALPNDDVTLIAQYTSYPSLFINYSFPNNYSYDQSYYSNQEILLPSGSDISSYLNSFKNKVTSSSDYLSKIIEGESYYYLSNNNEILFSSTLMPGRSLSIYLKIEYTSIINLITLIDEENIISNVSLGHFKSNEVNMSVSSLYPSLYADISYNNNTYLYDGLYYDSSFSLKNNNEIISGSSSFDESTIINIYKKVTKGILLSFTGEYTSSCYIIPGSTIQDIYSRLCNALNITSLDNLSFYIEENGTRYKIDSILPSNDSTIIVERNNN